MITGRSNYSSMTKKLKDLGIEVDLINNPDKAKEPNISVLIAGQYFKDKNLNKYADLNDIIKISRLVNGGNNGLSERIRYYNNALKVLV